MSILNPSQSKITLISALTEYDFDAIENTNASNPTIVYQPYYQDVNTLQISILKTSDDSKPSQVELAIFGCGEPVPIMTKAQVEPTSTSVPTTRKSF